MHRSPLEILSQSRCRVSSIDAALHGGMSPYFTNVLTTVFNTAFISRPR
jgi:hypothetical protein